MNVFFAIVRKEIVDNWRDRRALFFALFYGPLLLPLMIVGSLAGGIKKHSINFESELLVHSSQSLGSVEQFLAEKKIRVEPVDADWRKQLTQKQILVYVQVETNYLEQLSKGRTAQVTLFFDSEDDESNKARQRLNTALQEYSQRLASMRLTARGVDSQLIRPLQVVAADIAVSAGPEKVIARMLPFILLLSLTMGGFYLAVDSTAGERERHSLEPLLALSLHRTTLVLAKWLALTCFVAISGVLALLSCYLLLRFMPLAELRQFISVDIEVFAKVLLLMSPLIVLFSSSMQLIASFAKNIKEAQTHLGLTMIIPMAPFFVVQFMNIQNSALLSAVPVMGQFLLIEDVLGGIPISVQQLLFSVGASLGLAALFLLATIGLYKGESIIQGEA